MARNTGAAKASGRGGRKKVAAKSSKKTAKKTAPRKVSKLNSPAAQSAKRAVKGNVARKKVTKKAAKKAVAPAAKTTGRGVGGKRLTAAQQRAVDQIARRQANREKRLSRLFGGNVIAR